MQPISVLLAFLLGSLTLLSVTCALSIHANQVRRTHFRVDRLSMPLSLAIGGTRSTARRSASNGRSASQTFVGQQTFL